MINIYLTQVWADDDPGEVENKRLTAKKNRSRKIRNRQPLVKIIHRSNLDQTNYYDNDHAPVIVSDALK